MDLAGHAGLADPRVLAGLSLRSTPEFPVGLVGRQGLHSRGQSGEGRENVSGEASVFRVQLPIPLHRNQQRRASVASKSLKMPRVRRRLTLILAHPAELRPAMRQRADQRLDAPLPSPKRHPHLAPLTVGLHARGRLPTPERPRPRPPVLAPQVTRHRLAVVPVPVVSDQELVDLSGLSWPTPRVPPTSRQPPRGQDGLLSIRCSHQKFIRTLGETRDTVIVPMKRETPAGTLRSILNQAHIDPDRRDELG